MDKYEELHRRYENARFSSSLERLVRSTPHNFSEAVKMNYPRMLNAADEGNPRQKLFTVDKDQCPDYERQLNLLNNKVDGIPIKIHDDHTIRLFPFKWTKRCAFYADWS